MSAPESQTPVEPGGHGGPRTDPGGWRQTVRRVLAGTPEDMAGTIFGAIMVLAVLAAGSSSRGFDPWQLAGLVAGTTVVLWAGHVYAHALAESVSLGRRLDWGEVRRVARRQGSIPLAAAAPLGALCLGGLDILAPRTSVWLAIVVGVVTLGIQGLRYARLERLGRVGTAISVGVNVLIGLGIVALKVAVTH